MAITTSTKSSSSGSPRRRSPKLYYGQVWVERDLYNTVCLFAEWNNIPVKQAAHQLLTFGLNFYARRQLELEAARQADEKPIKEKLDSPIEIANYLSKIFKKRKELPKIPGQDEIYPG